MKIVSGQCGTEPVLPNLIVNVVDEPKYFSVEYDLPILYGAGCLKYDASDS
jgi:hypothetical protein